MFDSNGNSTFLGTWHQQIDKHSPVYNEFGYDELKLRVEECKGAFILERKRCRLECIAFGTGAVYLHWCESDFAWKLGFNPFWSDVASNVSLSLQYKCSITVTLSVGN